MLWDGDFLRFRDFFVTSSFDRFCPKVNPNFELRLTIWIANSQKKCGDDSSVILETIYKMIIES